MPTSLFIEHHSNGLAFYINGDLQFDTSDEALYHEYLVIPTVALAVQRFPQTGLRVLICGGGDGLAARDVLRFREVNYIDLVDYNPDVLELAQTTFKPYNQGSLESNNLTVYPQEAFEFVSKIPDSFYHVVICDFTYPTCSEDTRIYSREWFQEVSRILISGGIVSTNGVSPENRTSGFWCLYQTVLSAGLRAKPLQLNIPSFQKNGYGNWGFFLASNLSINRSDVEVIKLPEALRYFTLDRLFKSFQFKNQIAQFRHEVKINTLAFPQLFYYLLNPIVEASENLAVDQNIDFLEIQEVGTQLIDYHNYLQLESISKVWLEQVSNTFDKNLEITEILPVQHRYHSPQMNREWLTHLRQLLTEIDLAKLLKTLLERSQELPPKIAKELKQFSEQLYSKKLSFEISPKTAEFMLILSVTLLVSNLLTPDAVFAKGYYNSSDNDGVGVNSDNWDNKFFGALLTIIGGVWLGSILFKHFSNRSNDE